jgi:hypothetical protein
MMIECFSSCNRNARLYPLDCRHNYQYLAPDIFHWHLLWVINLQGAAKGIIIINITKDQQVIFTKGGPIEWIRMKIDIAGNDRNLTTATNDMTNQSTDSTTPVKNGMCQAAIRIHPANSVHQGTTTGKL